VLSVRSTTNSFLPSACSPKIQQPPDFHLHRQAAHAGRSGGGHKAVLVRYPDLLDAYPILGGLVRPDVR
jgi:hypothetical protein